MALAGRKFLAFLRNEEGGISLLLLFLFAALMGMIALSVDLVRYFGAQSAIVQAAHVSSRIISKNSLFVPEASLLEVSEKAAAFELSGIQNPSLLTAPAVLEDLSFHHDIENHAVTLTLNADVQTTLMRFFSFTENLQVAAEIRSDLYIDPTELVIVLDRSLDAANSGKLGLAKGALSDFLDQLARLPSRAGQIAVGYIPFGNQYANVSPYKSWVPEEEWPADYPPSVPGSIAWSGPLEEQRWCVDVRTGLAGTSPISPAEQQFPLVLDLQVETDPDTGEDLYSVSTDVSCSGNPVLPLQRNLPAIKQAVSEAEEHGEARPGRAMVWAERVLSSNWAAHWNMETGLPAANSAEIHKVVLMLLNSSTVSAEDRTLFTDKCQALKEGGVAVHILDYSESEELQGALQNCASTVLDYDKINKQEDLVKGFTEFARSLLQVKITDFSFK